MKYAIMNDAFGDFDQDTLPEIPESWLDASWRNDMSPSFIVGDPEGKHCRVWIDYADEKMREFPDGCRFCAVGPNTYELATDNWQDILDYVAETMK